MSTMTLNSRDLPEYEVLALRFAHADLPAKDLFLGRADIHDGTQPLDFYIWVVRGDGRTIVMDMGFGDEACAHRPLKVQRHPVEVLADVGVDAATVTDVVISHLHFDHAGNSGFFPKATFHLQDAEMAFSTGRYMRYKLLNRATDVLSVMAMVRHVYDGRVEFHDGDEELFPGISVHKIGGHTGGMQVMRVHTARGWVVLASDAAHFYANLDLDNPFALVLNIAEVLEGNRRLRALASTPEHIVPGHDPEVLRLYPPYPGLEGQVACVHLAPRPRVRSGA